MMRIILIQHIRLPVLILLLLISGTAAAQGILKGRVTDADTGAPVAGADIRVNGTMLGTSSRSDGYYELRGVPAGMYTVTVTRIGYRSLTKTAVRVENDRVTTRDVLLEETVVELDPVVVIAGKTEQQLNRSSVSISVVTSRDIERRGSSDLVQALEDAPGIHFVGEQINIRGSTGYTFGAGNKVLLLLDGVPVYASDTGGFNWDMVPPLDVKKIEVLKGAGSTLWGASALGGVVNVTTKSPDPQGRLNVSVSGGKYDRPYYKEWEWTDHSRLFYVRPDISYSKKFGRFGMRVSAGYLYSTGYHQLGRAEKGNLTGKFNYQFPGGITLTCYGAYSRNDRGYFVQWKGQNDPYEVDAAHSDNFAVTNQLNMYSRLDVPVSSSFALSARASLVRTLMGNEFGSSADFNPAFGQGGELQFFWIPRMGHEITGGLQFQQDAASTDYFGNHRGYSLGPYIQDEWTLRDNLRLTLGLRYDRYQLKGRRGEDLFSPRAGINWRAFGNTHFRASAGSGFRAASMIERFLEMSIMNFYIKKNEDLRAERSLALDCGVRQYLNRDCSIDISLFHNTYRDLIEAHMNLIRGFIQFRNIPEARIYGFEANLNAGGALRVLGRRVTPGIQLSATAMKHENTASREPLPYRPELLGLVKLFVRSGPFYCQFSYRYASEIEAVKVYPINDRVPMHFVDLNLSVDKGPNRLQIGVRNLLQYNYAPMESNLMPTRTFTAALHRTF